MHYTDFTAHLQPQKGFLSSRLSGQSGKQAETIQNQPISCGFLQCLTAHLDKTPVKKMKCNWHAREDGVGFRHEIIRKVFGGGKLLEEKTFSTDGFDSLVNNCSVKYDNQEPHQQFFALMFDSSRSGEAWSQSFSDEGPKDLELSCGRCWMGCGFTNVLFGGGACLGPSVSTASFFRPCLLSCSYSKNRWLPYSEEGLMSTIEILSVMSHSSEGYWDPTRWAADPPASFTIPSKTTTFTLCAHKSTAVCSELARILALGTEESTCTSVQSQNGVLPLMKPNICW